MHLFRYLYLRRSVFFTIGGSTLLAWIVLTAWTIFHNHQLSQPSRNFAAISDATAKARFPAGVASPAPIEDPCRHLYRTVCSNTGVTRDPTGLVRPDIDGEKMAIKIYEDITRQHPDWSSDQINEEVVKQIYTPAHIDRIESAHHWVRNAMEKIIDSQPDSVFNAAEKATLKARLDRTEIQVPIPVSAYEDESYLFTKNDIFYERTLDGRTRLRIGGAYFFTARSWFNQVFTLGHELAHSIDPCEIRSAHLSIPAYDRLAACLMDQGLVDVRRGRSECGEKDQLSETFADWFAVQVTAEALRGFSLEFQGQALLNATTNAVRDLCEQNDPDYVEDTEFHPSPRVRINRIFGRNPEIREILGCATDSSPPTASPLTLRAPAGAPPSPVPSQLKPYCTFNYQPQRSGI
ncbi:MAG: hypothetical protein P4M08_11355 [Oligoflexia bacterium]|nr:hypothetical protein [Oligoflexia bacterium]